MSSVTEITGWIELDGFDDELNQQAFDDFRQQNIMIDDGLETFNFMDMFVRPAAHGSKNPDMVFFGGSYNYFPMDVWLSSFESLLACLSGHNAFVYVHQDDGEEVFALGYVLGRGRDNAGIKVKKRSDIDESLVFPDEDVEEEDVFDLPILFKALIVDRRNTNREDD